MAVFWGLLAGVACFLLFLLLLGGLLLGGSPGQWEILIGVVLATSAGWLIGRRTGQTKN